MVALYKAEAIFVLFSKFFLNFFVSIFIPQHVFGPDIGDVSNMTAKETYDHSLRGIVNLQRKLTDLPVGRILNDDSDGYHPSMAVLSHSHFVNYGGEGSCSFFVFDSICLQYFIDILS